MVAAVRRFKEIWGVVEHFHQHSAADVSNRLTHFTEQLLVKRVRNHTWPSRAPWTAWHRSLGFLLHAPTHSCKSIVWDPELSMHE